MAETVRQRLDRVLDHVREIGAKPRRVVLAEHDFKDFTGGKAAYRDIPVEQGTEGQSSFVEADGAPSGEANFAI